MLTLFGRALRIAARLLRRLLPLAVDSDRAPTTAEPALPRNVPLTVPNESPAGKTSSPSALTQEIQPPIVHLETAVGQQQPPARQPDPIEEPGLEATVAPKSTVSDPSPVTATLPALVEEPGVSEISMVAAVSASDIDKTPLTHDLGAEVGKSPQPLVARAESAPLVPLEELIPKPVPAEQSDVASETEPHGASLPDTANNEIAELAPATNLLLDGDDSAEVDAGQPEDLHGGVAAKTAGEIPQQSNPIAEDSASDIRDRVPHKPSSATSIVKPLKPGGKHRVNTSAAEIDNTPSEDAESAADKPVEPAGVCPEALAVTPQAVRDGEADDAAVGELLREAPHAVASAEITPTREEQDARIDEDAGRIDASLANSFRASAKVPDLGDEVEEPDGVLEDARTGSGIAGKPSAYRPRLNRARARRAPAGASTGTRDFQDLDADLQILFGPGDWGMNVWALLRLPAAADEIAVLHDGEETWLGALDDQLLEPLAVADSAAALGEPLLIISADRVVRWSRSSRDLHIFGPHPTVAGFVSRARVAIGQENAVICRDGLASAALAQILATGSTQPVRIEGPGVPEGWTCWRGVRPARPSAPAGGLQILHALDPLPAVTVELTGGLQLSRGTWLEGHPPRIRLLGLLSEGDPVLIDGRTAVRHEDGDWAADGWDGLGAHRVEHGGVTAGYVIDTGAGQWDWWAAWHGATPLAGALADASGGEYFHVVPSATLIGARPGEICGFSPAAPGVCVARPAFEPVWLISARAGMRRGKASLVGTPAAPAASIAESKAAVARWARAICASGLVATSSCAERRMWNRYVAAARARRRQLR